MHNKFLGTGVALVTPFRNGTIDFNDLEQLINHTINGGVNYLVVLGTTGETATLSKTEQKAVFNHTIRIVNGRVPIVAGFGGNNTHELTETIKAFDFNNIAAILSVVPAYNKPTQKGIFAHFMAIEKASPVPIILYNVPSRTGVNMTAETTIKLAKASNKFIGIKEASGDIIQCMQIIKHQPTHFSLISGDDNLTLPIIASGGILSLIHI